MYKLYDSYGFLLAKASNQIQEAVNQHLTAFGLTPKQMGLLFVLLDNDGISQRRAGEIQQVDRTTTMQSVDHLEKAGYLVRNSMKNDRRSYSLSLTAEGAALAKRLYADVRKIQSRYLEAITPEERDLLKTILLKLTVGDQP